MKTNEFLVNGSRVLQKFTSYRGTYCLTKQEYKNAINNKYDAISITYAEFVKGKKCTYKVQHTTISGSVNFSDYVERQTQKYFVLRYE